MAVDLAKLNQEQKEAVAHGPGPLLIVAGAGTGKTTVITQRVAYLIEQGLAKPEEILAVTFTEKAASEMEERVDKLLPYGYVDLWISTFHSFCERVLRDHALDIGLPNDFKILDGTAGWLLVWRNLDKFELNYYKPLGNQTKFIQALIAHFSHCKDQAIYPEDYLTYAEKLKTRDDSPESQEVERIKEVASAYHVYQRLLLENSSLDFGDLINYCLELFKKRPLILQQYRNKFKYILVDEFQDTNFSQYELIKILASPRNNLTVCADDDQAIYRWRGASFSNIIQFNHDFPKAEQVSLVRNYRSPQNILDLAYKFIKANNPDRLEYRNKISKKLVAENKGMGLIEHLSAKDLEGEVSMVITRIIDVLQKDKEVSYNDFAILVRANDQAGPFIKALERAELPYQFLASKGLYAKPAVLDVISYFKLLDNYHESSAVYRLLSMPFLQIPLADIMKVIQYGQRRAKSLYEALEEISLVPAVSSAARDKIIFVLSLVKKHSGLAREKSVSEILVAFLEDSGYLKYLTSNDDKEQIDLLSQFYKRIKNFEETTIEPSLNNFMREIILEIESGEQGKLQFDPEQGPEVIKVMTIHGAKGLEFKYVFLANMVDKRFPTIERKDLIELPDELIKDIKPEGDVHLQEERRLCYVAMTRAKQALYFTSARDYGGSREKKPSRFLIELGYQDKSEAPSMKSLPSRQAGEMILQPKPSISRRVAPPLALPDHFSYSQLAAFEKCPLQYKFAFILKVPVRGKAVFSFGRTIHATLFQFLKRGVGRRENQQDNLFGFSGALNKPDNLDDLIKIYERNWIDDWYESKKLREEYYRKGKEIIKNFYDEYVKNPPKILKIGKDLALELPFNLKIGGQALFGVIDRIDEGPIILDYKTGAAKDKLGPENKEQLLIYQLAVEGILGLAPKELVYYYLEENKKVSFLGSEKEKNQLKEKILAEIEAIRASDFKATPGWQCGYCDFRDICDFAQR